MKPVAVALIAGILFMAPSMTAQEEFPRLAKAIPHLAERLRSTRREARYCLAIELRGRDDETRRALETLVQDRDEGVAGQATPIYLNQFVNVEKSVFVPGRFPRNYHLKLGGPEPIPDEAVRERCLERLRGPRTEDPNIAEDITILGIIGKPEDAAALSPFLQSSNHYIAIGAAKSAIRLGDKERGREALRRLAERDPSQDLFYVTEALYALKELDHPGLKELTLKILASIDRKKPNHPGWISGFLLLAADLAGSDVWKGGEKAETGDRPR